MIVERLLRVALLGSEWVVYLLIGLSVFALGAAAERWWFYRRHGIDGDQLGDPLCELLERNDLSNADRFLASNLSVEAGILRPAMKWVEGGAESLAEGIAAALLAKRQDLERGLKLLRMIGNSALPIGVFGTVIAAIAALHRLAEGMDGSGASVAMNGFAEALVPTALGLFVAVPAAMASALFDERARDVAENVRGASKQLCALLKGRGARWRAAWRTPDAFDGETRPEHAEIMWDGLE